MKRLTSLVVVIASLVAVGCRGGEDTKSGPVDHDGDGYTTKDGDCDDSDPSVHPDADDTWYDGIDSNCDGADDYDADGDGIRSEDYGGADCDDSNPDVSPAATEVWYDGIDEDCKGDDDYDADVDGFDSADYDGEDCDDSDPSAYPGAPDTWYDGVDSNCAGDDDYDADGDTYESSDYGGEDCDDSDDAINPGAAETWYDGVDEDCAGDDDYDADGDTHESLDYGGDDCDDSDPDAYPGASEQLDGHDTDCDGTADSYYVTGSYGGTAILGVEANGEVGSSVAVADIDGDGALDVLALQSTDTGYSPGGDGAIHVLSGADLAPGATSVEAASWRIVGTSASGALSSVTPVGDFDGDGAQDLAVASAGNNLGGSIVTLVTGAEATADSSVTVSSAARSFTSAGGRVSMSFGSAVAPVGDLDGDGIAEIAITDRDLGMAYLFLSSTYAAEGGTWSSSDADGLWGDPNAGSEFGSAVADAGDQDGDGYDEVAVGAPGEASGAGQVYLIAGFTATTSGPATSLSWAVLTGANEGDAAGDGLATADVDGDGRTDLVVGATSQDTAQGRVHVVLSADMTSGSMTLDGSLDTVSYTGAETFAYAGKAIATGDMDGDGAADLLIGGAGNSAGGTHAGAAYIEVGSKSGSRSLADADIILSGAADNDRAGTAVSMGDLNGDGLSDIVVGVPGGDSTLGDEGAVYVGYSGY